MSAALLHRAISHRGIALFFFFCLAQARASDADTSSPSCDPADPAENCPASAATVGGSALLQRSSLVAAPAAKLQPSVGAADARADNSQYPPNWPFLRHCLHPESPGGLLNYTLASCQGGQKSDFSHTSKIAVIGAGPAGVSISKLLDDRGFHNVKLIEIADRVGGKSKRYEVDGQPHELGTCYTTGKYECVRAWISAMGLTEVPIDQPRLISSEKTVLQPMTPPQFGTISTYMADYAYQHYGISPTEYPAAFADATQRYTSEWAAAMGGHEYMFPSEDQLNMTALNQTFAEWLGERGLGALIPYAFFAMSGQGYGSPFEMPAYYGLMWIHPNLIVGSSHSMIQEGWQALWEKLIETSSIDLHLSTTVKSIKRTGKGAWIKYRDGKKEFFDWLIMAAPQPEALALLKATTREEKMLFGSFNYRQVVKGIYHLDNSSGILPSDNELFSWADRLPAQSDYYRMKLRGKKVVREMYQEDGDDGPLLLRRDANIKGLEKDALGVFLISNPQTSDHTLEQLVKQDAAEYGLELSLLYQERWDYMPHYSLNEVVSGRKPWKIWDLQGKENTWWVGNYASFESVADILDYNLKLVNSRLCNP